MDKNIDEATFIIFDTETTGLEPESGDRIIEIAGIKLEGERKIETFHTLINPNREVSPAAYAVNGISQDMLKDAPAADIVLPSFLNFIEGACLLSYNAPFDMGFLSRELELSGLRMPSGIIAADILAMAKRLLPNMERYALWFVAEKLGVKTEQEHRALSDVELTCEVFKKLKVVLNSKGIFDFKNFLSLCGLNSHFLEDINNQKTSKIQEALDLGVKLKIKYISSSGAEVSEREVIPKEIKTQRNRKYLVGYCCLKNEERTFRIDGILHLEIV